MKTFLCLVLFFSWIHISAFADDGEFFTTRASKKCIETYLKWSVRAQERYDLCNEYDEVLFDKALDAARKKHKSVPYEKLSYRQIVIGGRDKCRAYIRSRPEFQEHGESCLTEAGANNICGFVKLKKECDIRNKRNQKFINDSERHKRAEKDHSPSHKAKKSASGLKK